MGERFGDDQKIAKVRLRPGGIETGLCTMLLALSAVTLAPRNAAAAEYLVAPPPTWVSPVTDPAPLAPGVSTPGGTRILLVDQQMLVSGSERVRFVHSVIEAVTGEGVTAAANVAMSFDPAYESLTLHDVRVWRAGAALPRLKDTSFHVMRRERGLESQIYDGRKTVSLILNDVRPGDAVEVSYTVVGHNPVFGAHQFHSFDMQWGVPAAHVRYRLLVRGQPPLDTRAWNGAPPPSTSTVGDLREFVWEDRDVPALRLEADTPAAYQPYRRAGWSDFAGWGDVARWAETLFPAPARIGPVLQAERDRIAFAYATQQARTLAVLRLVQEQVRYLGVEMGANSHAPSAPDLVFQRRFGDCKEKALLVTTLLRSLGVDSHVALVDSDRDLSSDADLPAPDSFDHAIVRVQIGKTVYWLDPTRAPQKGDLDHVVQSHFGKALVLDGQSASLAAMPADRPADRQRDVRIDIDLTQGSPDRRPWQVTTVYRGVAAERMRSELTERGLPEMQRRAANFYDESYPGIHVAAPLEVNDDDHGNFLTIIEHYVAPIAWKNDPEPGRTIATFDTPELYGPLRQPGGTLRQMPLDIGMPEILNFVLAVRLPHVDRLFNESNGVVDPLFSLTRQVGNVGDTLRVSYHFERRTATAAPGDLARYTKHLAQARALLDYELRAEPKAPMNIGVRAVLVEAALAAALLLVRWRSARKRAAQGRRIAAENRELEIRALHGDIVTLQPMPDEGRAVNRALFTGVALMASLLMFLAIVAMFGLADPLPVPGAWVMLAFFGLPGLWLIRLLGRYDPK